MKIYSVTSTSSRSNSLPVTPQICLSATDDAKAFDPIDHFIRATQPSSQRPSGGARTRGRLDVEASRGCLAPIQGSPCVSIQSIDTRQYSNQTQGTTSGETPTDSVGARAASSNYAIPVAQRGRLFARCQKNRRLVQKNGHSNVSITKVRKKKRRYIRDLFTTIMDLKWRYHVLLFVLVFLLSWLFFAVVWLALADLNGDINRPDDDNSSNLCLDNVYDFSTALLYSLETQTTIGYGYRVIGPHCPIGTGLLMAQSIAGIFVQCFITGIVFAKIARPQRRAQTIVFSNHAVICIRDGFYNLIFRVGDLRKTHIIGTSIRALLVKSRLTNEGELIPFCQYPLELVTESNITDTYVSFFWPVTIAHRITESSPLWNLSAETLLSQHFEMIIILEGTVQTSGSLIQIRTSYVPKEIRWGQRLAPLVTHIRDNDDCEIDFSNFHVTSPVIMPDWSAEEHSRRLANRRPDLLETDYPCSLTSPPVLCKRESNSNRRNAVKARLMSVFNGNRIGTLMKPVRRKKSAKDEDKHVEMEEIKGASSSETKVSLEALPPPPSYASVARARALGSRRHLDVEPLEFRASATILDECRDVAASSEGNSVWSRYSGQVNRAFDTSMA